MSIKTPRNILIVRTDRIGDVILTLPTIHAVRQHFFDAKISVLVTPVIREMLLGHPEIDNILVDDREGRHHGLVGFCRLVKDLRKYNFDIALILHTKKRTNLACAWAGIPERIGYKNNKYGSLLTTPLDDIRHLGQKHEVYYCLDVLKVLNINTCDTQMFLPVQRNAIKSVNDWLLHEEVDSSEQIVVFHPGASCKTKCWPTKSFAELAKQLLKLTKIRLIIMGDDQCRDVARKIKRYAGERVLDITGNLNIAQMVALLKRVDVLVSNDSGPVHVATALNTPVISLFLRNQPGINPERWRPLNDNAITLINKSGEEIKLDQSGNVVGGAFDSIPVGEVYQSVLKLLKRRTHVA